MPTAVEAPAEAAAMETATMKPTTAAMKLSLSGRRDCRDRRSHSERGYGR
jgi:hypothetical protein